MFSANLLYEPTARKLLGDRLDTMLPGGDLVVDRRRNQDAARLREAFGTRRDVDAVTSRSLPLTTTSPRLMPFCLCDYHATAAKRHQSAVPQKAAARDAGLRRGGIGGQEVGVRRPRRTGVGALHIQEVAIGIAIEGGQRRGLHHIAIVGGGAVARDAVGKPMNAFPAKLDWPPTRPNQ